MFRQGLRRCATQAGTITSASTMLRSRAAMPIACQPTIMLRSIAPSNKFISISRMYSTEEAAVSAEPEVADSASSDTMEFRELSKLGVHPALVQIITEKMRYDTMTPVQAKTITPALKGTDMYVPFPIFAHRRGTANLETTVLLKPRRVLARP